MKTAVILLFVFIAFANAQPLNGNLNCKIIQFYFNINFLF